MFKKPLQVQQQTMVAEKDRKVLQAALKESLNAQTVDAFFNANPTIQLEKLKGSKQLLYTTDDYPAFVDATGKGLYFPTVYVVAEYPSLVEEVRVKATVESLVVKGGNLMWDGVAAEEQLSSFKKDDVRAILDSKGQLIGLGAMGSDSTNIVRSDPAAYMLATIEDCLWQYGPKVLAPAKQAYLRKAKGAVPIQKVEESESSEEEGQDNLARLMGGLKSKVAVKKGGKKQPTPDVKMVPVVKRADDSDDEPKQKQSKKKGGKPKEEPQEEQQQQQQKGKPKKPQQQVEEESKEGPSIPIKVMDEYIKEAFLNAIKVGISDKNLPLEAQAFLTNYMLLFAKPGITLDLKNSTYGKIGKFLTTMAKDGLIEYKEAKKGSQPQLSSIDRSHETYDSWEPTVLKANKQEEEHGGKQQQYLANVEVQELYLPGGAVVVLFPKKEESKEGDEYYTREQVKKALQNYISNQSNKELYIQDKKNASVYKLMEGSMLRQLFPKEDEEDDEEPEQQQQETDNRPKTDKLKSEGVTTESILNRVLKCMSRFYRLTTLQNKKSVVKYGYVNDYVRPGEFKGLVVTAEKQHNKQVTTIVGLELFGFENSLKPDNIYSFKHLEKVLAERLSCVVTTHELPVPKNDKTTLPNHILTLNGVFLEEVIDFFTNECKINSQYVHEVNKIAAKKKQQTYMM